MQIYETLKNDHQVLRQLLQQLVSSPDENAPHALVDQIRDELIPHSRAEEAVFYNSLRSSEEGSEKVMHSFREHMAAETMLRTLQMKEKVAGDWKKTAQELKAAIEHHVQEEEGELFAIAKSVFTEEEATMMSKAFLELKAKSEEQGFMKNSLDLVANLMPPRFTERFRSFHITDKAS